MKRTPKQIERAAKAVLAYIQKHPECNAEAISTGTKLSNALISLPLKYLLRGRVIKAKGQARGTRYVAKTDGGIIIDGGVIIVKDKK